MKYVAISVKIVTYCSNTPYNIIIIETRNDYSLAIIEPLAITGIAWHSPIATRRERYRSDFRTVRHAGAFELLCKETFYKDL